MDKIRISQIWRYPIKSCKREPMKIATLKQGFRYGIEGDRRGMVTDEFGVFLSQRQHAKMALIRPRVEEGRLLRVTAPGMPELSISLTEGNKPVVPVQVWKNVCKGLYQGDDAANWFSNFLNVKCRLVWMPDDFNRPVDQLFGKPDDHVSFADGFPILMTSESSLDDLNSRLHQPVPMTRFRPNIVIKGAPAFAEDGWKSLKLPGRGVRLRVVRPCARCKIITIDQDTGEECGPEPLRTLASYRTFPDPVKGKPGTMFGQNVIFDLIENTVITIINDDTEVVVTE